MVCTLGLDNDCCDSAISEHVYHIRRCSRYITGRVKMVYIGVGKNAINQCSSDIGNTCRSRSTGWKMVRR